MTTPEQRFLAREAREKRLVREYFSNQTGGIFVEVGASRPQAPYSQTWHLEDQLGWSGVLVEANPTLAQQCQESRPRSKVFSGACVGPEDVGEANLYIPIRDGQEIRGHASVRPNIDDHRYRQHRVVKVPAKTLGSILEESGSETIDFLSIDVEGSELDVLRGMDLQRFRPALILMEDKHVYLDKHRYLREAGYILVKRTEQNSWYVPRGANRPPQSLLEKIRIIARLYLGIWWHKLRLSYRHRSLRPFCRL